MKYEDREKILSYLGQYRKASVKELATICKVTLPTMRKYLNSLHQEELLIFTRGSVQAPSYDQFYSYNQFYATRSRPVNKPVNKEACKKIGEIAGSLVQDGETIFIGGGFTVLYMLEHLLNKKDLTVVTNSLNVLNKLIQYPQIKLISTGGLWRFSSHTFQGISETAFQNFHPDKSFVGVISLNPQRGATQKEEINNADEYLLFKKATQRFILADHSKFEVLFPWTILEIDQIQNIITDQYPDNLDEWTALNIKILL